MKTIGIIFISIMSVSQIIFSQNYEINKAIFSSEETLVYKVKWGFLRLGTITIKTTSVQDDPEVVRVSMIVRSDAALFFIDIEESNETLMDKKTCTSLAFFGDHRNGKDHTFIQTSYNRIMKLSSFSITDSKNTGSLDSGTIYNCPEYVDGPSLFFFTRAFAKSRLSYNVPTMIEGKIKNTKLIFTGEKELLDIDAFPNKISTIKYFGSADWEGGTSQGLSGNFLGYVTDDDASIPVYAEVGVFIGSLKIELEQFHRQDYTDKIRKVVNK